MNISSLATDWSHIVCVVRLDICFKRGIVFTFYAKSGSFCVRPICLGSRLIWGTGVFLPKNEIRKFENPAI